MIGSTPFIGWECISSLGQRAKPDSFMLESLHVSGLKLFRNITLPKLGRLNLLVGENNTGKSCLLEAVSLYAGGTPSADVVRVARERSGQRRSSWDVDGINEEGSSLVHPIFDLFHRMDGESTKRIILEKLDDPSPLRLEEQLVRLVRGDDGLRRYDEARPGDLTPDGAEMALYIYRGVKRVARITRRSAEVRGRAVDGEKLSNGDALTVAFLPARGFSDKKAASMWDAIVQGPGQDLVLSWLRMLDPRIEDLAYIAGGPTSRIALLRIHGQGRIPLRSMGDGLTRMFHIALAVGSASRGVLLIDEFENGLHWRVQEQLWKSLARAARDFNVQVFSTTHSRDCVEGFTAAATETDRLDGVIYRLERRGDDVFATELPLVNVGAAIREHAEVR
jgi:hypothetical protein